MAAILQDSTQNDRDSIIAAVDRSCRVPVLYLILSGAAWLLVGTVFAFFASLKLHTPGFGSLCPSATYGRLNAASNVAWFYGFGCQTALALAIWMIARLALFELPSAGLVALGNVFWNTALTLGFVGILLGHGSGIEYLELPGFAQPLLFVAYLVIALWGVVAYWQRTRSALYVSQWYLFGALFWFPWAFGTALVLLFWNRVQGVLQASVAAWYSGVFFWLWLTPVALAVLYYLVPILSGRPLRSFSLSKPAFWSLAILGGWTGTARLVGGPFPAWMISVGIVASVLLLIPMVLISINLLGTLWARTERSESECNLRFLHIASIAFILVVVGNSANSLRSVAALTHFTLREFSFPVLFLHGFIAFSFYGSVRYMVPRLLGRPWPREDLIRIQGMAALLGLVVVVGASWAGAFHQGKAALSGLAVPWSSLQPYLKWRTAGFLILMGSHLIYVGALAWIVCEHLRPIFEPVVLAMRKTVASVRNPAAVGVTR